MDQPLEQRSVVARVGALLNAISASHVPLTLSEIAERADIPLSSAHRLLNELVEIDLVTRRSRRYHMNLHVFEIGLQIPWMRTLREAAEPHMAKHALVSNHVVNIGVLRGGDVLYVAKVTGPGGPILQSTLGGRLPAHCTALGKLLLAHLDPHDAFRILDSDLERLSPYSTTVLPVLSEEFVKIRKEGVAYDREEVSFGLFCAAVPVRSQSQVVAGVSVSARSKDVHEPRSIRLLKGLASQIEESLEASRYPLDIEA